MIVPISSDGQGPTAMGDVPSQSNLLMALATMHSLGKFDVADATVKERGLSDIGKATEFGGEGLAPQLKEYNKEMLKEYRAEMPKIYNQPMAKFGGEK